MNYLKEYPIKGKVLEFPVFFPDATRAVIRSIDTHDLRRTGVEGVVVNTYHLMAQPGTTVIEQLGGVKLLMNWDGWVASDSGGFQIMSLIQRNRSIGSITDRGVVFHRGTRKKKKYVFTPEKSIEVQFSLGADILVCLDDFTDPRAKEDEIEISVKRTIEWGKRCKDEFLKQVAQRKLDNASRPILIGVIQGGDNKAMREKCARGLLEIGFDGYGFGGWPLDKDGNLDVEIASFTASLSPENLPRFALGVGSPQNILECFRFGYNIFDCVLPTRDARHRRLYVFSEDPEKVDILSLKRLHSYLYILREKYVRDNSPISEHCDCYTCQNYSRAYLHHLFRIEDSLSWRLATIHNLRMYTRLIGMLRGMIT